MKQSGPQCQNPPNPSQAPPSPFCTKLQRWTYIGSGRDLLQQTLLRLYSVPEPAPRRHRKLTAPLGIQALVQFLSHSVSCPDAPWIAVKSVENQYTTQFGWLIWLDETDWLSTLTGQGRVIESIDWLRQTDWLNILNETDWWLISLVKAESYWIDWSIQIDWLNRLDETDWLIELICRGRMIAELIGKVKYTSYEVTTLCMHMNMKIRKASINFSTDGHIRYYFWCQNLRITQNVWYSVSWKKKY